MKYLIIGIIMLVTGIGLGVWHLNEPVPAASGVISGQRPLDVKKILAPFLSTFGMFVTFAGIVSVWYNRPKKKRNYYRK